MTDMKLAVVPYTNDQDEPADMLDPEYVGVTHDEAAYVQYGKGKITREQIETAARAFHDGQMGAEEYDFDDPRNATCRDWCLSVAKEIFESVGFGVEGE